jgi:hypothetical protein
MGLKDSIRKDVTNIFLNENDFAERIVYFFRSGGSESVSAIVERSPSAIYDAASNVVLPVFQLTIANSCQSGITMESIDVGGDEVEVIAELGNPIPRRCTVIAISERDFEGAITLSVV